MDNIKSKTVIEPNDSLERELTNRFINGELSFAEYSQQWGETNYADDENISDDEDDRSGAGSSQPGTVKKKKSLDEEMSKANRRLRRQLPPALLGLMGEANLRYARGEKEMAEKMCYEIIRQVPTASEPFQALAQIYETDPEKSLQFSMIAAHLNPVDSDQWMRLAALSKERGNLKQEVICYTRAINANPRHLPYHYKRIEVMKELEEKGLLSSAFNLNLQRCYLRLLGMLPNSEGATILSIAKIIARKYHSENSIYKALKAMNIAYEKCPELFTLEDVNLYLELLIAHKMYETCLDILVAKGGVEVEAEVHTVKCEDDVLVDITQVVSCTIPTSLPVDLRSKLAVCLIHMKAFHLIENLIDTLEQNADVEVAGDLFLDIEEALTAEERHEDALRILKLLVSSTRYSLPAVWLKYAECLTSLHRKDEAVEPFKTVIKLAPQHLEARKKLADILIEKFRLDEALIALEQNEQTDILNTSLLYERCKIYKCIGDLKGYLKVGELLLSRHFYKIRNRDELAAFKSKDAFDILKPMREARGEQAEETDEITFDDTTNPISLQTDWKVLDDMIKISHKLKLFTIMERISFSALGSKRFSAYRHILELTTVMACLFNEDYYYAYSLVKEFVMKMTDKSRVWNLLNLVFQRVEYTRHNKFIMRLLFRLGNSNRHLYMLHANNCLIAGSYKYALKEYISCFKELDNPLCALLAGITMTHMACQKFSTNKHTLIIQSAACLSYYEKLRGPDAKQEVYYNIGRAYHQTGLLAKACEFYKKALNVDTSAFGENADILDLKHEIAFNMHLIYMDDAPDLALMYLEKYIII